LYVFILIVIRNFPKRIFKGNSHLSDLVLGKLGLLSHRTW